MAVLLFVFLALVRHAFGKDDVDQVPSQDRDVVSFPHWHPQGGGLERVLASSLFLALTSSASRSQAIATSSRRSKSRLFSSISSTESSRQKKRLRTRLPLMMARRNDGYYKRPSAAVEQGGSFFVPGASDIKLRQGAAGLFIVGLILNRLLSPGEPLFTQIVSEGLGASASLFLFLQAQIQRRLDEEANVADLRAALDARMQEQVYISESVSTLSADRAVWMSSALEKLTPAFAVYWLSGNGDVLVRCGRFMEDFQPLTIDTKPDMKPLLALLDDTAMEKVVTVEFEEGSISPPSPLPLRTRSAMLFQYGESGGVIAVVSGQPAGFTRQHELWLELCSRLLNLGAPKSKPNMQRSGTEDRGILAQSASTLGEQLIQPETGIATGAVFSLLLVGNRLFADSSFMASQTSDRSDLIGVVASAGILAKAVADLDITPREAEYVKPIGKQVSWIDSALPADAFAELEWAADSFFSSCDSTSSVALWRDGQTLMLYGTIPPTAADTPATAIAPGPLLAKVSKRQNGAPDYLPALQLLPGRVEFSYLPENTQGVLMLPLKGAVRGAFIIGCSRKRGFTPADVEWARAVTTHLSDSLAKHLPDSSSITE